MYLTHVILVSIISLNIVVTKQIVFHHMLQTIHLIQLTLSYLALQDPLFMGRVFFDLLYFFFIIIIVLNLFLGVIIDTFAALRSEKQEKEDVLNNSCFICGTVLSTCTYAYTYTYTHVGK